MEVKLSICIATYNRAEYIGETLESIIPQLTDEVEIVIADGASTDNTSSVVNGYVEICKQIRYIRLPAKGGVDQDYCKAVEHAQGEMCWLFTDDDLLKPNAIKTVLDAAKNDYSLIVVNAQAMSEKQSGISASRLLKITTNEIYDKSEFDKLFQRVIAYISFIGCVVIDRQLWLQREKKRYFGSEFVHVGVIFQAPLPHSTLLIAEPFIEIRIGNDQWRPRSFDIWMRKWPMLLRSFTGISQQIREEHVKLQSWHRLKHVIFHRARGEYSLGEYQRWLELRDSALWWRMVMLFIAIVPSTITKSIILSYFGIVNREALRWWR
jgi:glycosyltransferase involved in cell wall biosynthesis